MTSLLQYDCNNIRDMCECGENVSLMSFQEKCCPSLVPDRHKHDRPQHLKESSDVRIMAPESRSMTAHRVDH